jgi:hypothetical protein
MTSIRHMQIFLTEIIFGFVFITSNQIFYLDVPLISRSSEAELLLRLIV